MLPYGLELGCTAALVHAHPFSRISACSGPVPNRGPGGAASATYYARPHFNRDSLLLIPLRPGKARFGGEGAGSHSPTGRRGSVAANRRARATDRAFHVEKPSAQARRPSQSATLLPSSTRLTRRRSPAIAGGGRAPSLRRRRLAAAPGTPCSHASLSPNALRPTDTVLAPPELGRWVITRKNNGATPIQPLRARQATSTATRRGPRRAFLHPSQARLFRPSLSFGRTATHYGLERGCPVEASRHCWIVRQAGGPDKHPRKRRPPGQSNPGDLPGLQRVVGRAECSLQTIRHPKEPLRARDLR